MTEMPLGRVAYEAAITQARRQDSGTAFTPWEELEPWKHERYEAAVQAVLKTRFHDDLDIALDKIAAVSAERDALKDVAERTADDRDAWLKTAGRWRHTATDLAALRQAVTELAGELDADAAHYARGYDAAPDAALYARADAAGNHADRLRKLPGHEKREAGDAVSCGMDDLRHDLAPVIAAQDAANSEIERLIAENEQLTAENSRQADIICDLREKNERLTAERGTRLEEAVAERDRLRDVLRQLDPAKLDLLADWLDADDARKGPGRGTEVQADLRRWAARLREADPGESG